MLGIDTEKKTMSSGMFRQLSSKLESNQSTEFLETRKYFENQLKERLNPKNKPLSESLKTASKKLLPSRKEISRSIHRPSPIKMSVGTPPRAPVPTPRSSKNPSTPLSLMARDGEASSTTSHQVILWYFLFVCLLFDIKFPGRATHYSRYCEAKRQSGRRQFFPVFTGRHFDRIKETKPVCPVISQ